MPRGGKRPGAGRNRVLDDMERLRIGGHCERLWREAVQQSLHREIDAATKNVQRERKLLEREKGAKKVALDDEDLLDALRLDQGLADDETPSRLLSVRPKQPKGRKPKIKADIAATHGLTERMVQTCWDEFRAIHKDS